MIRILPVLFFALALSAGKVDDSFSSDLEAQRRELDRVKKELEENRSEIRRLEGQESDLVTKLRGVETNLALTNRYLKKLSDMEGTLARDVDSITSDLGHTVMALNKRKAFLRERVRQIYIRGRYQELDVLFGAETFSSFLRRNIFYRAITQNDQRLIKNIFAQQDRIRDKKTDLEIRLSDVQRISEEKRREQKAFEEQKKSRRQILSKVKGEKKSFMKLVAELEKRQEQINQIVAALESARKAKKEADRRKKRSAPPETDTFSALKGRLPWPVDGKIVKKFGTIVHPVYGTKTINNGVDIAAHAGDRVESVAGGEVAYVGNMGGFGNFLIVSHAGGYYSLYANLASVDVKKGQAVKRGDAVGSAGDTGVTDDPQVHFELRLERKILDPVPWLR